MTRVAQDTELAVVLAELRAVGLKPTYEKTGGNHYMIHWLVPGKEPRSYVVASTGSDWRGRLNARADVRRLLKADNVSLKVPAPKPALHRALEMPRQADPIPDQVEALRAEVAELTGLITELGDAISYVKAQLTPRVIEAAQPPREERKRGTHIDLTKYLTLKPRSVREIADAAGIQNWRACYNRLDNLRRQKRAERVDGKWRLPGHLEEKKKEQTE